MNASVVNFPPLDIPTAVPAKAARTDIFYEAVLIEMMRMSPGSFNDKKLPEMGFGFLCYDSEKKEHISYATSTIFAKNSTKFLQVLSALTHKNVRPEHLAKMVSIDTSLLIGRHLSIKFSSDAESKFPKVLKYMPRKKDKWTEIDVSQYHRPGWVERRLIDEDEVLEEFDGDLSAVLGAPVPGSEGIEVSVTDEPVSSSSSSAPAAPVSLDEALTQAASTTGSSVESEGEDDDSIDMSGLDIHI